MQLHDKLTQIFGVHQDEHTGTGRSSTAEFKYQCYRLSVERSVEHITEDRSPSWVNVLQEYICNGCVIFGAKRFTVAPSGSIRRWAFRQTERVLPLIPKNGFYSAYYRCMFDHYLESTLSPGKPYRSSTRRLTYGIFHEPRATPNDIFNCGH